MNPSLDSAITESFKVLYNNGLNPIIRHYSLTGDADALLNTTNIEFEKFSTRCWLRMAQGTDDKVYVELFIGSNMEPIISTPLMMNGIDNILPLWVANTVDDISEQSISES